jgi:hypothetical protein
MDELVKVVLAFRDERDWKQFHNPKDLAISISCWCRWRMRRGWTSLEAAGAKLRENAATYPVEQAKGSAKKYDELAS